MITSEVIDAGAQTVLAHGALSVAAARTPRGLGDAVLEALGGAACPLALGLYLDAPARKPLIYSARAPERFLLEYDAELSADDPLISSMRETPRVVDGRTLLGDGHWRRSPIRDHLRRWGFSQSLCGPLCVGDRLIGVLYAASHERRVCQAELAERVGLVCRAGSIALTVMAETGRLEEAPPALSAEALGLPPRSAEVAVRLCEGGSNKQIARDMRISEHTVKEHVANLCRRFGARNRTELVGCLMRRGREPMAQA
ncbi:LuxR family transcriptional regulator [Oceanicella sp. SM1341]|uniref:helix-turn-helix transcriptional regulator n=1 Tax=Oceanicella sp. SM1341 TaxID=1548889 RepID=UPI00130062D6|nr:LuxR family transcriptional regulator [Oceanicella sp. SM1341]